MPRDPIFVDVSVPASTHFRKAIAGAPAEVRRLAERKGALAAARTIRLEARRSTAFTDRTGALRKSIRVEQTDRAVSVLAGDPPGIIYAGFVEFGHGGPRPALPHPYLRPAVRSSQERQFRAGRRAMQTALKEYRAKLRREIGNVSRTVNRRRKPRR